MNHTEEKIAIVGAACYFPKAPNLQSFFNNIKDGRACTGQFPFEKRWGPDFYQPDVEPSLMKTYCNQGGAIEYDIPFDPLEYTLPPNELLELDPDQVMAVNLTRSALQDAGITIDLKALKDISCGVILGKVSHVGPASARLIDLVRLLPQTRELICSLLPNIDSDTLQEFERRFLEQRCDFSNTRGISVMSNLLASRVAERLNLNGPSYIVDGACASSLIAVQHAARELRSGNADIMAAGGVLYPIMSGFWKGFSYLGGLSRKGHISAFDQAADGIVLGEGGGIVILKRLQQARQDGDRIYAVLESIECNNDGRGTGILAPSQSGQERVIQRSWSTIDIQAEQLSFIECHGTGMPLGDTTEIMSITNTIGRAFSQDNPVAIGSVKSQIGHTLSASGVAGLIKSALCLYHRLIPPTSHCDNPIDEVVNGPFRVVNTAENIGHWEKTYACVNAFGFGGVNSHAILSSEDISEQARAIWAAQAPAVAIASAKSEVMSEKFPDGAFVLARQTKAELLSALAQRSTQRGVGSYRLIIRELTDAAVEYAVKVITTGRSCYGNKGVFYGMGALLDQPAHKIALMYPGVSYSEPEYQSLVDQYAIDLQGFVQRAKQENTVKQRGSESMILSYVLTQALLAKGVNVDAMAGFSLGEFSAFICAGVIDADQLTAFLDQMEETYADFELVNHDYLMVSVNNASEGKVSKLIADMDDTYISLINSANNLIVTTHKSNKKRLTECFQKAKILFFDIGVDTVNHTPLNQPMMAQLQPLINELDLNVAGHSLWSSITATECVNDESVLRELLYRNLFTQVNFRQLIENMYDAGYRVFIQCGIGGISGYINDTLRGKPYLAIDAASNQCSSIEALDNVYNTLWVEGLTPSPELMQPSHHLETVTLDEPPLQLPQATDILLGDLISEYFPANALIDGVDIHREAVAYQAVNQGSANIQHKPGMSPDVHQALLAGQQAFSQAQAEVIDLFLHQENATPSTKHAPASAQPMSLEPTLIEQTQQELFSFKHYPEFRDHEILKHPPEMPERLRSAVVPMSCMIYRACEAVNQLFPDKKIVCLSNIMAQKFIDLKTDKPIQASYKQLDATRVEVRWQDYFRCVVELAETIAPSEYDVSQWVIAKPNHDAPMAHYASGMLFHGSSFQGLLSVDGTTAEQAMLANVKSPGGYSALLDSIFQISACWYDQCSGDAKNLILPQSIKQIRFFCDSRDFIHDAYASGKTVLFNADNSREKIFSWDADYFDGDRLLLEIRGFQDFKFESSEALQYVYQAPEKLTGGVAKPLTPHVWLFQASVSTTWSWDLLRSAYLSAKECDRRDAIQFFPEQTAFISGRVAAKEAYRQRYGRDLHLASVQIDYHDHGAPYVSRGPLNANLPLSISHKPRIGVAILGESQHVVGIDIELIASAAELNSALVFSQAEQQQYQQSTAVDRVKTAFWTAKEAFIKSSAQRYQHYAHRLFAVEVTEFEASNEQYLDAGVGKSFKGKINHNTPFYSVLYADTYMITWIQEREK